MKTKRWSVDTNPLNLVSYEDCFDCQGEERDCPNRATADDFRYHLLELGQFAAAFTDIATAYRVCDVLNGSPKK